MASTSELLIKYGFYTGSSDKPVADEESFELYKGQSNKTGYPKPKVHFRLIWETPSVSMEEVYFWITTSMRNDGGFNQIVKISDVFSASQSSSFFGASSARLGLNQDRLSGLLAQIGKLIKDLFQIVRELRVIDQKLEYYNDSYDKNDKAAEISLKGIWVDQVEGGAKNPASVYGLAREVGFTILPDLFFDTTVKKREDVDKKMNELSKDFNRKTVEVLGRKLYSYLDWKEKTFEELKTRRNFTLKYMRQHYDIIRMYMAWVKPYLKYSKMLQMDPDKMAGPDLVSAFEGSLLDLEVMGLKRVSDSDWPANKQYHSVLIAEFNYRTMPTMPYHQDEYRHKGPLHVGRVEFHLRSYAWTKKQIDNYIAMRQEEELELLGSINESIKAAMDALGSDMKDYLKEAGEKFSEDEKAKKEEDEKQKKQKKPKFFGGLDPFISVFKGVYELTGALIPLPKKKEKSTGPIIHPLQLDDDKGKAAGGASGAAWAIYKNFKKAHRLLAW